MKHRWVWLAGIAITVTVLDQWTKFLAVDHLTPLSPTISEFYSDAIEHPCRAAACPTIEVIPGFWNHRYVQNPGAAWGFLSGANENLRVPFFLIVSIVALGFIITYVKKLEPGQYLQLVGLSLVFGGAVGNFIDRIHLTYVIDFIDWYAGNTHWPTFNVADAGISTGVGLLLLDWAIESLRKKRGEH